MPESMSCPILKTWPFLTPISLSPQTFPWYGKSTIYGHLPGLPCSGLQLGWAVGRKPTSSWWSPTWHDSVKHRMATEIKVAGLVMKGMVWRSPSLLLPKPQATSYQQDKKCDHRMLPKKKQTETLISAWLTTRFVLARCNRKKLFYFHINNTLLCCFTC